jgi:Glycosyl hydrolase family 99
VKTKNKISGYIIRGAAIVVLFSSAIIGFTWAVNLPNRWSDLSWRSAEIAKPATQTRTLTFADRVPYRHTAVWTGSEMIVWGGITFTGTGGRYNPGTNSWTATSITNAPSARGAHTAVWTGSEMIVWGGVFYDANTGNLQGLNTGGRYYAQAGAPTPTPTGVLHAAFYYPWFPQAWGNLSDPFTNYHPSLGYYSSDDASVIANHVDAMIYAHLDAGISSWWGQGENTENTRFPAQLAAANGRPFKWTLYYEKEGYGDPTVSELTADLNYVKSKYANNSSYLTRNGKPVIFVYGDGTDGCGMADRWKQANAAVGNTFYVVLKVFGGYTSCVSQPDGWHEYGPAGAVNDQPGYSFFISPGFWKKGEPAPRLTRDPHRWKTNIVDMMNSHEPLQLVETFNEWGEGTAVESAQEWASSSGYGTYLDALHNLLPASLTNISTRLKVLTGDNVLIGGLIIAGSDSMTVLFRALGPTLSAFNVPGVLADPTLELHTTDNMGHDVVVATNDNWKESQQSAIAATGKAPPNDRESAVLQTLAPGNYTAIVRGKNNGTGVALVEAYDVSTGANSELVNTSSRGFVDTNANVMIDGFIVGSPSNFLVRALGPTLGAPPFNIPGAMTDPTLELHDANGALIASNDNWKVDDQTHQSQQAAITATGKAPPHDSESAILRTLAPDNYTAILKGKNNTTGIALLEVYNVP